MKFKPATSKYIFSSNELTREFPPHLQTPITTWIKDVMESASIWSRASFRAIDEEFLNSLDLLLREPVPFPRDHKDFLGFVLRDPDRTINIIALCLQNYANPFQASKMENILATGGSAYAVMFVVDKPNSYDHGISDIVDRVPEIVVESSEKILSSNDLIKEAWHSCYSRNPDYEKTVGKCVDALEGLFKAHYFPADTKPSLGRFLKDFTANPLKLTFQGETLVNPKSILTNLATEFIPVRGHHTSGTGRAPTKEEAVFVLHYTIFVLQIHS